LNPRADTKTTTAALSPRRTRSLLLPREHGAYGQLALPLVTALAMARPTGAAALIVAAAVTLFLAHEPVLVALGQRGRRAAREHGARARWLAAGMSALALVLGAAGLALAPPLARAWAALPAGLGLVVAGLIATDVDRTTQGEAVTGAALATAALPVALASHAALRSALLAAGTFALTFAVCTGAVRAVILRFKRTGGVRTAWVSASVAVLAALAAMGLGLAGRLSPAVPLALLPPAVMATGMALRPVSTKQLKAVGWSLVAATSATALVLAIGLR
jgi:hypothetical protein